MNKKGPIIVIDDDEDDRFFLEEIFASIQCANERMYFADGIAALEFFENANCEPFLIFCDINMPRMDGFELRRQILASDTLDFNTIPYIFLSTSSDQSMVQNAYKLSQYGFFTKQSSFEKLSKMIKIIVDYWGGCCTTLTNTP